MKRFLITLLLVVVLSVLGVGSYFWLVDSNVTIMNFGQEDGENGQDNEGPDSVGEGEIKLQSDEGDEGDGGEGVENLEDLDKFNEEIRKLLSVSLENDQAEEVLGQEERVVKPKIGGVAVPASRGRGLVFSNPFISFEYPANVVVETKSLNEVAIFGKNNEFLGEIFVYNNPEEMSLEEFVEEKENLVNYFLIAEQLQLESLDFKAGKALRAVKFPEILLDNNLEGKVSDIYLVELEKIVVLARDFSKTKVIGEYLLKSIEKYN